MNKIIKSIITIVMTLTTLLGLTGCNDNQRVDSINIAFVVGIADGETKFNDGIAELVSLPARPGSDYVFISAEGEPRIIGEPGTIPDLSERGYTGVMMERVGEGIKADLTERLASYVPVASEIDIASATEQAVRNLSAHTVEGRNNYLVYYCSGKSTIGLINMLETPVYKMDVQASATAVAQKMNLDMSGISIIWYCCGDYYGTKQPKLSADEKAQLKAFYEQLFRTLGAKSITFMDDLPSTECYHFPSTPVSCMDVERTVSGLKDKELIVLDPVVFEEADATVFQTPIMITEEQVCYKPDSADFLDSEAAATAIQPIVDLLAEYPELNILLYGTCAGDADSEYTLWLGKARAEKVKEVLVAAGIDERRITAVTVKVADDPYYQFGLGNGSQAVVNRKTVIIDMRTELAHQILENAI